MQSFDEFLEYADLGRIGIAIRNLIIRYIQDNGGDEIWFEEFLEEADGLFALLDTLQVIYPSNENMNKLRLPLPPK